MFRYSLTTVIFFIYLVNKSIGSTILAIVPTPSERHQKILGPIWQELSLKGHQITIITPHASSNTEYKNITEIDVKEFLNGYSEENIKNNVMKSTMELYFSKESIKQLLENNKKFDLVIVESFLPEFLAFADYYKCPSVLISVDKTSDLIHSYMGNVPYPLINPKYLTSLANSRFRFIQRAVTLLIHYFHFASTFMWTSPIRHQILKNYFGQNISSPRALYNNVDLLLTTFNPVFHDIVNIGPATVPFTSTIDLKPPNPLAKDLQEYLDSATEGCIYFSLGTNSKSIHLEQKKIEIIKEALGELPYKILWKFESEEVTNLPNNIKLISWVPQQDILRHPNVKLFITQGGIQSLEEAIVNHVPMAMLPVFGDQEANAKRMELKGIAKIIPHQPLPDKDEFKRIIFELINDSKYKDNIIKIANLLLDQPMGGVEKAVWWIEYVIRHKGAKHLRNPALDVPFYQYYSLDVIAALLLITYILFKLVLIVATIMLQIGRTLLSFVKIKNQKKKTN
ncbi:UDP-glycosyltransferase UGT5-like isoform X2 [Diorhabda sublineata]|uniref:UDP-glycosyltransferase UGT5-like isoform X2 n=1 Tax=Diorhabda sublineata TaxID=1163346 RepID=UPI0024E05AC2|nr:UDP-glycosyltransferase UGT5-like isoform X2 [Diorhabda sublineata]